MDWDNLILAFLLYVCILVISAALQDGLQPKKMFISENLDDLMFLGLPFLVIFTNYDDLEYVSWAYFIGLAFGAGIAVFVFTVVLNQIIGFVNNLDHNRED